MWRGNVFLKCGWEEWRVSEGVLGRGVLRVSVDGSVCGRVVARKRIKERTLRGSCVDQWWLVSYLHCSVILGEVVGSPVPFFIVAII